MDTPNGCAAHRAWERELADARWSAVTWPARVGGRDYSQLDWLLFEEEYFAAGAPPRINQNGLMLLGPTLLEYGTQEQQERVLPSIASGETLWAQAWSEPDAGSDLAAVRCQATPVPGGFRLVGQKTWSSRAAVADAGFGLFRSEPDSRGHRGLTYLMFPLHADGVTVRPIRRMDGEPVFGEVFFDGLFVPSADAIGDVGAGWQVAMSTAGRERGTGLRSPGRFIAAAARLIELWRRLDPARQLVHRKAVLDAWLRAQAYRLHGFRALSGLSSPAAASVGKPYWSDLDIHIHKTALSVLADLEAAWTDVDCSPAEFDEQRRSWQTGHLFALAGPIYAGTNEIQRQIVAERVLGLPKG
jgi:alkylation response protein AidB-like acyl-CoA dehydrogenase